MEEEYQYSMLKQKEMNQVHRKDATDNDGKFSRDSGNHVYTG